MHIERLRAIKPQIQINRPKKPSHLKTNAKREMKNMERMSEIQYQNRILLRKMLQIDLKPSKNVVSSTKIEFKPESNPNGLNAYNSLNRAVRIKEIARVADDNKQILTRLQSTKSNYSTDKWNKQFDQNSKITYNIKENSDRYCKNPYFLHSVCTQQDLQSYQAPFYNASTTNLSHAGGLSTKRSRCSSAKRLRPLKKPRGSMQNAYSDAGSRPFSAAQSGGRRLPSASKKKPRAQSSKQFKQIKQYLSEQEAQNQQYMQMQ